MSKELCSHEGCSRERFVDHPFADKTKCIFHCEKNDWFEIANAGQWNEKRDWGKSQDKINLFWTTFKKEWNEGKYDYSHFVFPKFEEGIFKNLYHDYLKQPDEIKIARDKEHAYFVYVKFLDEAEFSGMTFTQKTHFTNSIFKQDAHFTNATFTQGANFNSVNFAQSSFFEHTTFTQRVFFFKAIFTKMTFFDKAVFSQGASFSNATFTRRAFFKRASFTQSVYFSTSAAVNTKVEDEKPRPAFNGAVSFEDACFYDLITFENRNFKAQTRFTNAKFAQAPNMHGAELHSNTDFTGISCGTAEPNTSHGYYRWLKEKMEGTGDRRAASLFYAAEQHCLLKTNDLGEVEAVISWFYKSASYYGSSISLPLGWLLGFQLLFPFLFFNFKFPSLPASPPSPFSIFISYLIAIVVANSLFFYFFLRNSKDVEGSAIIGKVPIILAISFNIVATLFIDNSNRDGYEDNWIMLLTNLFRPFYGWDKPPHSVPDYLIGLLHLTLMYSAFALLLFAIRRRFKME